MTIAMTPAASWALLLTLIAVTAASIAAVRHAALRGAEDPLERNERARDAMRRAAIAAGAEAVHDPRVCPVCCVLVGDDGGEVDPWAG